MNKKYKVVMWYEPKKRFVVIEKGIDERTMLSRAAYLAKADFKPRLVGQGKKLRKVMR